MQCPTCGKHTHGTLSRCVHCDAPVTQRPTEPPAQEPHGQNARPADGTGAPGTHQFGHNGETWSAATPQGPSGPGPAESGPQPWTADSAAIERWASESPLTGRPWSQSSEPTAAQPGHAQPGGAGEPWSPPPAAQGWTSDYGSAAPAPGADPKWSSAPQSPPPATGNADAWYAPPSPAPRSPGEEVESTQSWTPEFDEPPARGPAPGQAQTWQPEPGGPQRWTPGNDATQAWSAAPPAPGGDGWRRADDHTPQGARQPESIVPDSWFSGIRASAPPEAPERWTPQHEPMNRDQWAAQAPTDAPHSWGPQGHNGHGPMGQDQTAMLASDFPRPQRHDYADERGKKAGKPLIFAVASLVVAALLAVTYVMWPSGTKKPLAQPSPAAVQSSAKVEDPVAKGQATAVNSLLNASAVSRGQLGRALVAAKTCNGLPPAIGVMQRVAQQRRQQISKARTLKVDALANGPQLRAHLARSMQISLDVDRAYLSWAQHATTGCKDKPKADGNYRKGGQLSNQATVSKQRFAVLWAPVAREQKLHARTANQF